MSTSTSTKYAKPLVLGIIIGGMLTVALTKLITSGSNSVSDVTSKEKVPLYWVAPMDANYIKDKPGKSPMGMDLVPVYDDGGKGPDEGPGTIRISPDVVNNLGVRTVNVQYKKLNSQINTVGYVTYNEDKLVHIHPRVQGWIEKLYVKAVGDPVKKNQPLYDIYSPELVNAQEELLLALERKNNRLINAAENRLSALQLPKLAIKELKKTRKVQQKITFYSPQTGVVESLNIREGFFVKPGTTLMSVANLSEVWVEAEVFERQASLVKTGLPVTMTLDYLPGQKWQGQVDYIYPMLDAKTRTVKVRLRFNNEAGDFKPNMFAEIAIDTTSDKRTLIIPKEALIRTGNQDRVVLALGEGSFKSVEVSVGRYGSDSVEILTGLTDGDKVVSSAQFLLDSESSKSSDFKRMHYQLEQTTSDSNDSIAMTMSDSNDNVIKESVSSATVNGTVISTMVNHRMVTIDREAIVKWDREADRVDFIVDEKVDMTLFSINAYVMFTFEIRAGNFIIVSAMAMSAPGVDINNMTNDERK
ncbi:efflux RND transporter periplasmic adaptor subunit [Colwellia sp. BRX8-4]|uniref:efflux RND transporter periplasmic adaptor subunit n=1 Tax=Colwellia sp. BRX8-4 TaxID=2759836 RepID=UPI0015F37424|nr:efflux RND transporter periplasmic adaptor subunit [Colwellia sp. BRX8-4]MBA6362560.1 efflux RND transporter periplasmic adaptor subunit [Colwellia sp. BRX8-8]MBA6372082.1 efflux RND transporter periplasmic adaptor subunit [Colwellia sp. BRX8-4]